MKLPAFQAAQSYDLAKAALKPAQKDAGVVAPDSKPENAAFKAIHELSGAIVQAEKAAMANMTSGADPHSVVEAIAAAELAVETAVTIRDKVVEAYQELIRMPI